jgi:hypothetical protein
LRYENVHYSPLQLAHVLWISSEKMNKQRQCNMLGLLARR